MQEPSKNRVLYATYEINGYPFPERSLYRREDGFDTELTINACLRADRIFQGRGDYQDRALHKAIAELVSIYEHSCATLPSLNVRPTGALNQVTFRRVADGPLARFMFAFFSLDPQLPQTTISNALELRLAKIRRLRSEGDGSFGSDELEHPDPDLRMHWIGDYWYIPTGPVRALGLMEE